MAASTDVTGSTSVSFKQDRGASGKLSGPYLVRDQMPRMVFDTMPKARLAGGAITIATGTVTVPAGTTLVVPISTNQALLVQFNVAQTVVAAENDHVAVEILESSQGVLTVNLFSAVLATMTGQRLVLGQATGGPPPTVWADLGDLDAPPVARRIFLTVELDGTIFAAGTTVNVISPITGHLRRVRTHVETIIAVADSEISVDIGAVEITQAAVTVTDTSAAGVTDDSGEITSETVNLIVAGDTFAVQSDGAATGAVNVVLEVEPGDLL